MFNNPRGDSKGYMLKFLKVIKVENIWPLILFKILLYTSNKFLANF